MDKKDLQQSHSQNKNEISMSASNERQLISLESATKILEELEGFTLQKILDVETRAKWIVRLSRVQPWRLKKLNSFTGRLEQVWKYLDEAKPDHQPADPDQYISLPDTGYTKDFLKYMAKVTREEYAHTEAGDQLEREWVEEMKVKYPWIKILYQRKANLGLNK